MGDLGTALQLMYLASRRFRSVHATVTTWRHLGREAKLHARLSGNDYEPSAYDVGPPVEAVVRIWIDEARRLREERETTDQGEESTSILVCDGDRWWFTGGVTCRSSDDTSTRTSRPVPQLARLFDPRGDLCGLTFEALGRAAAVDRPAFLLRARSEAGVHFPASRGGISFPFNIGGGDDYELLIDAKRGVILGLTARAQGEEVNVVTVRDIEYDKPVDPALFVRAEL